METESCLVLCIEECDNLDNVNSIDTRLFITYDFEDKCYVLYGKRDNIHSIEYEPYFFRCNNTSDLYNLFCLLRHWLYSVCKLLIASLRLILILRPSSSSDA